VVDLPAVERELLATDADGPCCRLEKTLYAYARGERSSRGIERKCGGPRPLPLLSTQSSALDCVEAHYGSSSAAVVLGDTPETTAFTRKRTLPESSATTPWVKDPRLGPVFGNVT
jgi:hypothetical protein